MRHNFVNDIGDYAKYSVLRALCSGTTQIRLGVIWYLTDHTEQNGDGRKRAHLAQEGWEALDPDLLIRMRQIEDRLSHQDELHLRLIEESGILPRGTTFFSEALPHGPATPQQRASERNAWFERAQDAVAGCDLVFLDPDNGLEVRSVPVTSRLAGKYATATEIAALLSSRAGIVLYQHGSRIPWQEQRERVCDDISERTGCPLRIRTLRFRAYGVRAFFCITAEDRMTQAVDDGLDRLRRRVAGWDKAAYLSVE